MTSLKEKTVLFLNPDVIQSSYKVANEKSIMVTSFIQVLIELLIDSSLDNLKLDPDYDLDEDKIISKNVLKKTFAELFETKKLLFDDLEEHSIKQFNTESLIAFMDSDIKMTQNSKMFLDNVISHLLNRIITFIAENENDDIKELFETKLGKIFQLKEDLISDILLKNMNINLQSYHKNLHNDLKSLSTKKKQKKST
jgi:hypothetical protein